MHASKLYVYVQDYIINYVTFYTLTSVFQKHM